jgi:hypothetical protein
MVIKSFTGLIIHNDILNFGFIRIIGCLNTWVCKIYGVRLKFMIHVMDVRNVLRFVLPRAFILKTSSPIGHQPANNV